MKLRSKDIINGIFALMGYKLESIRTKNASDVIASDPFEAQRGILEKLGVAEPVILDVGANKGDTAALYRSMFSQAKIHCFEPFPETIAQLEDRFGSDADITIVPKAVSTEVGETTFFVNHAAATNSLLPRPEQDRLYPESAGPKGEIKVETVDLDSYCKLSSIKQVGILKLDIQGGELMAIAGARRLLSEQLVDVVYSEIQFVPLYEGAAQFDGVWSKMRELGYALFDVYDLHRSEGGRLLYGDALFVSQRVQERVIRGLAGNRA
jgi:FkbM family methyltransferase